MIPLRISTAVSDSRQEFNRILRTRSFARTMTSCTTSKYCLTVLALVCALGIFYRTYHVRVTDDGSLRLDKRSAPCVGPQVTPVKRPEPYFSFAQNLAREVARDDAVQVSTVTSLQPNSPTYVLQALCHYQATRTCDLQGVSLVLYGDSITEQWRGTDGGNPVPRADGAPEVFHKHFGKHTSAILAEGGKFMLCPDVM